MKQWILLVVLWGTAWLVSAQSVTGTVTDEKGEPLIGAALRVEGSALAAVTDLDGKYTLGPIPSGEQKITCSYVGFGAISQTVEVKSGTLTLDFVMKEGSALNEVVVIGYGTTKKKDLTGSVVSIGEKDFQKGNIVTPEQLVAGKVAGVQITSNGGAPGAGSRIRIRGGSSLNATNDPLIVIDGVPVDNSEVKGAANPLNMINPNDIETFTVLKDASATAIYGSRASNGVIIITTKKGKAGDKPRVELSTVWSVGQITDYVDVLSADDFRNVVDTVGNNTARGLLDTVNSTDWQREIYRTAVSHDNNLSLAGSYKKLPYRVSLGYTDQNGILKRSNMNRLTGSVNLSPVLMDGKLRIDASWKGSQTNNLFADQGAIGSAVAFDPTKPVNSDTTTYGGYFEWLDGATGKPNVLAARNPVGLLMQRDDKSQVMRSIGNVQIDYRFHFLPDLRANLNVGYDISNSTGTVYVPVTAASAFNRGGIDNYYEQHKQNKLLEFYLNYAKDLKSLKSRIDVMAGYSYQDFIRSDSSIDRSIEPVTIYNASFYKTQNTLISFYGRLNYSIMERYLLTFTLRNDGSSRFSPDNRWGLFPSAAFAWRIKDEAFLRDNTFWTDMKLRLGYGVTGQQDVFSDYPYLPKYTPSLPNADYQFGDTFYTTMRPEGYDADIKWEETTTYNAGFDFNIREDRLTGSLDFYKKDTRDLLAVIAVPAGSNLTNRILTNVGNLTNRGVEVTLGTALVKRKNLRWDVSVNVTYNRNQITNLTRVPNPDFTGVQTGGIAGGVGNTIQIHTVGYPVSTFYVYEQVYDEDGNPIEGEYADINGDSTVNADDFYRVGQPDPTVFAGLSTSLTYKNFSFGLVARANTGNLIYNNIASNMGAFKVHYNSSKYLGNMHSSVLATNFENNQYFSDYYLEDASFIRLDNISLGYQVPALLNGKLRLRLSAMVQNALLLTRYSGLDPEIAGGIDNNFYPRPRTYSFGVSAQF